MPERRARCDRRGGVGRRHTSADVWETGTPIGWGRYTRVGVVQGSEPPNGALPISVVTLFKIEVARALAELKHPAPAVANAATAVVRSSAGSWTQNVAPYLGTGVTFVVPSVVVLAGWPEYGSVLPPRPAGQNCGTCTVRPAWCSFSGEPTYGEPNQNCRMTGTTPRAGVCLAGETKVKDIPHCASSGQVVSVPEIGSAVTFGSYTQNGDIAISGDEYNTCRQSHPNEDPDRCAAMQSYYNGIPTYEYVTIGTISINNVTVRSYTCATVGYTNSTGPFGSGYYDQWSTYGPAGPSGGASASYPDALCCTGGG